jgi:hypothetical protein
MTMSKVDYKLKYQELKLKYMNAVDTAYRLGFQAGQQQAQVQQVQEQQAQQQAMEQAAMQAQGQGQPGEEGQEGGEEQQAQPGQEQGPMGSELDQHISQLESMLGKAEKDSDEYKTLKKSLDGIKSFRQSQIDAYNLKKAQEAVKIIGEALNKPAAKPMSAQAQANMNPVAKRALTKQEEILKDVFSAWEKEEATASKSISDILNIEGITSKE